ncbi:proteasome maturation protein-like [Pollicipes pollicipes]|uniref:proteasome maturation protein-like n=1 Tax=Pollicipes pollicipes TaxID=41117 RepID=UPI0018857EA7|nr:proteasome maturation protein-like [Pollicipes pollicipes]
MSERREYGAAADRLTLGLDAGRPQLGAQVHPAQASVARSQRLEAELRGDWLRRVQGVHAPLRQQAELRAAGRVGRLPFMRSSNLMADTLTGRDETLDFSDYLGAVEGSEVMGLPHAVVEKQLGLL